MSVGFRDPIQQHLHPPTLKQVSILPPYSSHVIKSNNKVSQSQKQIHPSHLYLAELRKKINNKQLEESNTALRQISRIFIKQQQKGHEITWKIMVTCLSMACLILHQLSKQSKKQSIKIITNPRFLKPFLRLNQQTLLNQNQAVQSSLCYILQLCSESGLLQKLGDQRLIEDYKRFSLSLLQHISNNPKTVYNSLKIIDYLQSKNQLQPSDYVKYNLVNTIKKLTLQYKSISSPIVYQLSYRLILNTNHIEDAFKLHQNLNTNNNSEHNSVFLKSLSQTANLIPQDKFKELLKQYLFEGQKRLQSLFYRLLRRQFKCLDATCFLQLLEAEFLEAFAERWRQVTSQHQALQYVSVLISVQEKAKELMMYETVKDKILGLLPFLLAHMKNGEEEVELVIPDY